MRRRSLWWVLAILAALGVAALIVAALILPSLVPNPPLTDSARLGDPLWVAILSPRPGSPATVGVPVEVRVTGFGEHPLTAFELWADGSLAEAYYPPADTPVNHLAMGFAWIPKTEGRHILVARALDDQHGAADSNALWLDADGRALVEEIKTGPEQDQGAFAVGGGGPGPGGSPGPAEPLPQPPPMPGDDESTPAVDFHPSWIPAWLASAFEKDPPAAPGLAAELDGCNVNLAIHDQSDNEDGFRIYRKTPGAKKWEAIAELAAQSDSPNILYTVEDAAAPGWYRAEAFNAKGQAVSLPQWVDVSAGDCGADQVGPAQNELKLVDLKSDVAADRAYCYASIGLLHWQRLPAFGFFPSQPGGFKVDHVVADLNLTGLGGEPASGQPLDLECWGWAGANLQPLGRLHVDLDPGSQGTFEISGDQMSALLDVYPVYKTLEGDGGDFPSPEDFAVGGDPNLPYTFALVTDNVENCKSHTPSGGSNLLEDLLFCTPYPEFPDNSQPYLTWWLIEGACPAGKDQDCYTLDSLQNEIDQQGGRFGYQVYDCDTSGLCYLHDFPFDLTAFVIPPFTTCGEPRYFVAQFNVYLGSSDYPALSGPGSPPFQYSIPCPEAYEVQGYVEMDVAFDSLTLGNIDDGESSPEDVELYGYFRAHTSSGDDSRQLNLGEWGYSSSDCPGNEDFSGNLPTGGGWQNCPSSLKAGTWDLANEYLCQSDYQFTCYLWPEDQGTDFVQNNSHLKLRVLEGNAIQIETLLIDYDSGSDHDTACHVVFSTPNWPLDTWSGMSDAVFTGSQGDNGNASCAVKVTFTVVGP